MLFSMRPRDLNNLETKPTGDKFYFTRLGANTSALVT